MNRYSKTIHSDCKYWQLSCDLCGITGNDYCPKKCKDYDAESYGYYGEDE